MQKVLYAQRGAGTRQRVHDHYLKGTVWCARCQRRLILRPSTSKTGNRYFYYICRGVQEHDCDLPALPLAKVEHAVTNHYTTIEIPAQRRTRLEPSPRKHAPTPIKPSQNSTPDYSNKQLTELDQQEDKYLDLLGDPDWPQAKLKSRLRDLRDSKLRITRELEDTTDNLDPGRTVLTTALDLLDRPHDLYDTDDPEHHPAVTTDDLNELLASLVHAIRTTTRPPRSTQNGPHSRLSGPTAHLSGLLAFALAGQSASKDAMVDEGRHCQNA